jgi:hypothetical protein
VTDSREAMHRTLAATAGGPVVDRSVSYYRT